MSSDQGVIWVAQSLARFGEFYWSPLGSSSRTKEDFCALAVGNWKEGLAVFLQHYAFERSGAPRYYSQYASEAVRAYQEEKPQSDFKDIVWNNFLRLLDGKPPNDKHNPLNPSNEGKQSITSLVLSVEQYNYNIIQWARDNLNNGQPSKVFDELCGVRGIGEKIASFFLRDVAGAFMMDELGLDAARYLQPMDIWTKRGSRALAMQINRSGLYKNEELAKIIVEVSQIAGVRPSLLNTGLWVFGALFMQEEAKFLQALTSPEEFRHFLTKYRETYRARVGIIEEILLM